METMTITARPRTVRARQGEMRYEHVSETALRQSDNAFANWFKDKRRKLVACAAGYSDKQLPQIKRGYVASATAVEAR